MPNVITEIIIPAPLEKVYAVAKDIEKFPEFLPDVESVVILERTETGFISDWVAIVEKLNRKIKWREEDIWDDAAHICTFRAVSGDWEKYDGIWTFTEADGGTMMTMNLDCAVNVPLIGALIKTIVSKLAKSNIEGMFEGIKQRVLSK